jgi:hypothetical protein
MKYEIIEVQGIDGVEEHVIVETANNEYITFPALDSNPNYIQFKKQLAEEQK